MRSGAGGWRISTFIRFSIPCGTRPASRFSFERWDFNRNHMSQELWTAVDNYIVSKLLPGDSSRDQAVRASEEAGLPSIQVSPAQGKFLYLLAKVHGAKRILEIGTLGGYSTIWLARALPADGRLVT